MGKPGHFIEVFYAVPARKMIQLAQRPAAHPVMLLRQIRRHPLAEPGTRLREAHGMQIAHHIRVGSGARIAG